MMHRRTQYSQKQGKRPQSQNRDDEPLVWHLVPLDYTQPRVDRNGKHEKATGDVSNLQEPRLEKARCGRGQDLVDAEPMERHDERNRLLQVGQKEVVDQDDILVVADVLSVVFPPADQPVCDEDEQSGDAEKRHHGEDGDGD